MILKLRRICKKEATYLTNILVKRHRNLESERKTSQWLPTLEPHSLSDENQNLLEID